LPPLAVLAPLRSNSGARDGRVIANYGSIALRNLKTDSHNLGSGYF